MAKIKWTPKAVEQLEQIIDFISKNSPHYATLTARQIFKRIRLLKKNPRLGRKVPERNDPSIRELIHNRYRIVYKLKEDRVEIWTVFDSSQDPSQFSREVEGL